MEVAAFFFTQPYVHSSETYYREEKKSSMELCSSVVDWMEADLNLNLQLIVRKELDLSGLNDWRS